MTPSLFAWRSALSRPPRLVGTEGNRVGSRGEPILGKCSSNIAAGACDIVLYLCERGHVEGGMVFQLLENLTEMSTIKDCKDIFGYIESQQDVLGKQELFGRGKLVMLRTCNQLLRRLSKVETIRLTESLSCTFSRIAAVCLVLSCVTCIERRLVFTILFIYLCAVS
ncbi:uncharacterized protein [Miscanthus floridulus]|uniref:uncharacterized protein n=1 Tax=Miscanthus floridulus TaxID=154761 RepID=UPI003459E095